MKAVGEASWLLTFTGDEAVACRRAGALARAIRNAAPAGLIDAVVASRSLLVIAEPTFDPEPLIAWEQNPPDETAVAPRRHDVPVQFGGGDLDAVASHCGLAPASYIEQLAALELTVGWIGFLPGFPYLLGLPQALQVPRRATPRAIVPPGSVAVAAGYLGIYPSASPGGWNLIGRTEFTLFEFGSKQPARMQPGDRVRLRPR